MGKTVRRLLIYSNPLAWPVAIGVALSHLLASIAKGLTRFDEEINEE